VRDGADRTRGAGRCGRRAFVDASPVGSDAAWSAAVVASGSGAAGTAVVVASVADAFVLATFFADAFLVAAFVDGFLVAALVDGFLVAALVDAAFFGDAFFGDALPVTTGTGAGTASEVGSGASAGTIGSAPMSGVERRLARSPDARAAPAARAP